MELVPEEKLGVITTEKPVLSPSNENVKETLFPVDFDVDSSLEIEVTLTNMHQFVVPGEKYPRVSENMTEADFQNWKNSYLQEYLADRSINKTGNKDVLVKNGYGAYCLNLPVTATDYLEEQEEIKKNYKEKLILENGLVTLPDPVTLQDGWYRAPENLPNTVYDDVIDYLDKNDAGKAYRSGKSLLDSEHLSNVMTHNSNNIRYTFVRGYCFPEQRTSNKPYDVWVCLHKDTGSIVEGACSCVAG